MQAFNGIYREGAPLLKVGDPIVALQTYLYDYDDTVYASELFVAGRVYLVRAANDKTRAVKLDSGFRLDGATPQLEGVHWARYGTAPPRAR